MPIQVRKKKLIPWHNDLADEIKVAMLNEVVDEFSRVARNELSKIKCDKHPGEVSYILITPDRVSTMIIKRKFCCPEFAQKITMKLNGYRLVS
ncbi:MAG TPA: hypothetical protein VFO54_06195 [Chryseosolibacter sp.]|nr:hypothetical protein [Chryseosolibacter sp.]